MPKSQSDSNFAEWRCIEQHLTRNDFHAKHIENLSVVPHMPSQMTPDKECLNTHSFLNLMGIWPPDSSSFVSANAQKLFRFFSSMACKYLHKSEQEAALFRAICWSGCSAPWLTAKKTSCCCLQSSWGLPRDVSSTACAYSALTEVFWHFERNWRKKDRNPAQWEHEQQSLLTNEHFLRLAAHRRKLRNFQIFSGKAGSNFQTGTFWAQKTVK